VTTLLLKQKKIATIDPPSSLGFDGETNLLGEEWATVASCPCLIAEQEMSQDDIPTFCIAICIAIDIALVELQLSRARTPGQAIIPIVIVSISIIDNTIHPLCTYHMRQIRSFNLVEASVQPRKGQRKGRVSRFPLCIHPFTFLPGCGQIKYLHILYDGSIQWTLLWCVIAMNNQGLEE
jgi:hypothetical protein